MAGERVILLGQLQWGTGRSRLGATGLVPDWALPAEPLRRNLSRAQGAGVQVCAQVGIANRQCPTGNKTDEQ